MLEITEAENRERIETILTYHRRTKHGPDRYAPGPETLDWDAQPSPYRTFTGAPLTPLPLVSAGIDAPYAALTGQHRMTPALPDRASIGALLELGFGLSAIKQYGPDRWALRCNPSSGNLHPTETYVIAQGFPGVPDGIHHYRPQDHALEHRCTTQLDRPGLWLAFSSIQWREAWKYGERAFRYCQLDIGHALGAVSAACALLGWSAELVPGVESGALGRLLGLGRDQDYGHSEREEPEVLLRIATAPSDGRQHDQPLPQPAGGASWAGQANLLDPHPMYRWPIIEEAADASRGVTETLPLLGVAPSLPAPDARATEIILTRRSAQRYDRKYTMPLGDFEHLLDAVLPLTRGSGLHLLAYIHSVAGLDQGLYALTDSPDPWLRSALDRDFAWEQPSGDSPLGIRLLAKDDFRKLVRALTCHQAIAADACVTLCMLAEFAGPVTGEPWRYRKLHWQAGLIGQRLYLEAGALGHAATGIGCFLDDEVHRLIGLGDETFQTLYHFAIGRAITDERISSAPAYADRTRDEASVSRI